MNRILDLYSPAAQVRADLEKGPVLAPFMLDAVAQIAEDELMDSFLSKHDSPFDCLNKLVRLFRYRHLQELHVIDTAGLVGPDLEEGIFIAHDGRNRV